MTNNICFYTIIEKYLFSTHTHTHTNSYAQTHIYWIKNVCRWFQIWYLAFFLFDIYIYIYIVRHVFRTLRINKHTLTSYKYTLIQLIHTPMGLPPSPLPTLSPPPSLSLTRIRTENVYTYILTNKLKTKTRTYMSIIYPPICTMQHTGNFWAVFNRFEFRVFLLIDRLPYLS